MVKSLFRRMDEVRMKDQQKIRMMLVCVEEV